jgi:hypothetical protein
MEENGKWRSGLANFVSAFVRGSDGSWTCVAPATWQGPPRVQVTVGKRFIRGAVFMGVDLAKLLDEQYEKDQRRRR